MVFDDTVCKCAVQWSFYPLSIPFFILGPELELIGRESQADKALCSSRVCVCVCEGRRERERTGAESWRESDLWSRNERHSLVIRFYFDDKPAQFTSYITKEATVKSSSQRTPSFAALSLCLVTQKPLSHMWWLKLECCFNMQGASCRRTWQPTGGPRARCDSV